MFEKICKAIVFCLLTFTTVLFVFEKYVSIPFWIEPLGRLHPLTLHFPIAFIALLVLLVFFQKTIDKSAYEKIHKFLLLLTALSTSIAVIMGFVLHLEGYGAASMTWHKWTGLSLGYLSYFLLFIDYRTLFYKGVLYSTFVIVIISGHHGANLTHGSDFITQPLAEAMKPDFDESQPLFTTLVQPVLKSKCTSCHNPDKHKGGLDMSSISRIEKGGDNGPLWVAKNVGESALINRALLPIEHEDHMPPEGKTQLSDQDLNLLKAWISHGSDSTVVLAELSAQDSLYMVASEIIQELNDSKPKYTFDFADRETIEQLNSPFRSVIQKSSSSPALDVTIFGRSTFEIDYIKELSKIKNQIIHLNLSNLPVGDGELEHIAQLKNLESINLNNTDITHESIKLLTSFTQLSSLSLSGTKINKESLALLGSIPKLNEVYLWNTAITDRMLNSFKEKMPHIRFEFGYIPSLEDLSKLTPPVLAEKKNFVAANEKITLVHKFEGVHVRFTTDGSEPDSTSTLYSEPISLGTSKAIKAYAHKDGWEDSDVEIFEFEKRGYVPLGIELEHESHPRFTGKGAITLIDNIKGNLEIEAPGWLGFSDKPLDATVDFGSTPPEIKKIVVSYGITDFGRKAPPKSIEIWGGQEKSSLKLLQRKFLPFYKSKNESPVGRINYVEFSVKKDSYRFYRIKAYAYDKLPSWHENKGESPWLAVDQILFY